MVQNMYKGEGAKKNPYFLHAYFMDTPFRRRHSEPQDEKCLTKGPFRSVSGRIVLRSGCDPPLVINVLRHAGAAAAAGGESSGEF